MIETYYELSPAEYKRFKQFLESPFLNSNKKLPSLADELINFGFTEITKPENKKKIWSIVTGDKKFSNDGFKKMMSDFNSAYERFISISEFEKDSSTMKAFLNHGLIVKGDFQKIKQISQAEINKISQSFLKNDDAYINLSKFYDDLYNCESYFNPGKFPDELVKKGKYIDYSYAFSKLHNYITLYTHKHNHRFGDPEDERMIKEVLSYIEEDIREIENSHPNIFIPYLMVIFFKYGNDKKVLTRYEKYLNKIEKKLDDETRYYFRLYLSSMYSVLSELGDEDAWNKNYLNHKKMADSNILTLEKYLGPQLFLSIVFEGLHAKDFSWIKKFIKNYADRIMPTEREPVLNLALSRLHLYLSDYEDALKYITMIKSNSPVFYLNIKITYCFIYLEQNAFDLLETVKDSMKKYTQRSKRLPAPMKSNIINFLKYFNKLEKAFNDEYELKKLLEELKNTKTRVPSKNLFIDKISKTLTKDFSF